MKPSSNTADMTKGSPVRLILTFSIPLIIGNIFQQLYNMVDTVVVAVSYTHLDVYKRQVPSCPSQ